MRDVRVPPGALPDMTSKCGGMTKPATHVVALFRVKVNCSTHFRLSPPAIFLFDELNSIPPKALIYSHRDRINLGTCN